MGGISRNSPGFPDSGTQTVHPAYRVLTENFDDIRTDAQLRQAGADVYYAFDVFDLVQYAFPVDVTRPSLVTDQTYNDQVALFEVFQSPRLVLLPEYRRELTSYLDGVASQNIRTERLIMALKGTSELTTDRSLESIASELSRNVHAHLAVLMGFAHIGADRMLAVKARVPSVDDLARMLQLPELSDQPDTELSDQIFDELWSLLQAGSHRLPPFALERMRDGAHSDADAVARIIRMNVVTEKAFVSGRLSKRTIILYLSTAHRSQRLFALSAVRRALPTVNGSPLRILRTRGQVFAGIIFREFQAGSREDEDYPETLRLLDSLALERERIKGVVSQPVCASCILDNGSGARCPLAQLCRRMKSGDLAFQNLSLVPQLRRYEQLLNQKPAGSDELHLHYINFFRRVLKEERLPDIILARRHAALASRLLVRDVASSPKRSASRRYLPAIPDLQNETYRRICAGILEYPALAVTDSEAAARKLHLLEGEFLDLDVGTEGSAEKEIVRAMLYLTLGSAESVSDSVMAQDGDARAVEYCRQMMIHFREKASEFRFIMIWALARLGETGNSQADAYFREGRSEANHGIKESPLDPRFHHGRALITSCWLGTQEPLYRRQMGSMVRETLQDSERAIELYRKDRERYRYAIAVNLNNVAWTRSTQAYEAYKDGAGIYDLKLAAEALERLNEIYPLEEWGAVLPFALHTAAHVNLALWHTNGGMSDLQKAYELIQEAHQGRPDAEIVLKTKKEIEAALVEAGASDSVM